MATLREIRGRIRSIEKIRQITRAMKTVSLVKLMRAQSACVRLKPYAARLGGVISDLTQRTDAEHHPLLALRPEVRRLLAVVFTSDQGLAGAFNHAITARALEYLRANPGKEIELWTVGKRGRDFFRRQGYPIDRQFVGFYRTMRFPDAVTLAGAILDRFLLGALDGAVLVYNEFKTTSQQQVVTEQLLPIRVSSGARLFPEYLYEPDPRTVLDRLLPMFIATEFWRALLESVASEHASRMNAMDLAARNATDMIADLTLSYNKNRQAGITKELAEITSAAEAIQRA